MGKLAPYLFDGKWNVSLVSNLQRKVVKEKELFIMLIAYT